MPLEQLQLLEGQDFALVSREEWLAESIWGTWLGTHRPGLNTTKPGALAPGICLLSRGAVPRGSGAAVRSVDRFQIRVSLVVGRSCRRWYLGPGVEWDVPLSPGHLRRCSERRVSPPGMDTPGTSVIRQECWSRGRIVSALLSAAQGGCLPSMEPPNPVAATMLPLARAGNGCSGFDTGQHFWQRGFMKGASPGGWRLLPHLGQAVGKTARFKAVKGTSWSHHQQPGCLVCD